MTTMNKQIWSNRDKIVTRTSPSDLRELYIGIFRYDTTRYSMIRQVRGGDNSFLGGVCYIHLTTEAC